MTTRIQAEDFEINEEIKRCVEGRTDVGGVVTFLGTVRDISRGKGIQMVEMSSYSSMADKQLAKLRTEALRRFEIINLTIVHRVGELKPTDNIVCIVAAARHRKDAFDACRFAIDELKKTVPIWKKESTDDGEVWVDETP